MTAKRVWMRSTEPLPDDPLFGICLLTYASDMTLLDTVLVRHGLVAGKDIAQMASLDHAMWFKSGFRADDWFLFVVESPFASGGRGLAAGRFFDSSGNFLASVVQEGMIRVRL